MNEEDYIIEAIENAITKLSIYRGQLSGEYFGGMEHTQLIKMLKEAQKKVPFSTQEASVIGEDRPTLAEELTKDIDIVGGWMSDQFRNHNYREMFDIWVKFAAKAKVKLYKIRKGSV